MNRPHPSQAPALVDHGHARVLPGSVDTAGLQDDAVTAAKIAPDAVGSSEIAANAVGSSELADNAVDTAAVQDLAITGAKIANDTVTATQIAANAVGSSELADNAVDAAAIATGAVTATKLSLPMVRCVWNANTSVPNDGSAAVAWGGTDLYDTDTMHNPASNNTRITIGTAGVYSVGGWYQMAADADGARGIAVRLNNTTDIESHNKVTAVFGGATADQMHINTEYKFAAADFVELIAAQTGSGTALNVTGGAFWASYKGPG